MHLDLVGIFAAGLLTFVSPCILPLVPVYLGMLGGAALGNGEFKAGRTTLAAVVFTLGLGLVFVGLGLAATQFGRALIEHRALLLQLGGLLVFLFGLKFLGVLNVPFLEREARPLFGGKGATTLVGAFAMGAAFGLGWTPCIGPVLGSVLTFAASTAATPAQGAMYLGVYAAGLALPLVVVAAIAPVALRWIKRLHAHLPAIQKATGALLAVVGLLILTDHLGALSPSLGKGAAPMNAIAKAAPPPPAPSPATSAEQGGVCAASEHGGGACAVPAEGTEAKDLTAGAAQAIPQGPALIEFVGSTCPVCLRMTPVVAAAERDCAGKNVAVKRIVVDAPGGLPLARRYGVLGVPTFLFIDASGEEVARLVGEQPLALLEQSLQVLSGEKCANFRAFPVEPNAPPQTKKEPAS